MLERPTEKRSANECRERVNTGTREVVMGGERRTEVIR
jgi:hypothetical protein